MVAISWPNRVTLIRIAFIPVLVVAVMYVDGAEESAWRYVAAVVFLVMAASDAVDGVLARWFHQRTVLGRYLDPLADKFLLTTACVLLGCRLWPAPRLPSWLPVLVISREVVIVVGSIVLFLINGRIKGDPSVLGKLTTVFQMAAVSVTLLNNLFAGWLLAVTWWTAGGFTVLSGVHYTWVGTRQLSVKPSSVGGG